jgi:hypothetical protein
MDASNGRGSYFAVRQPKDQLDFVAIYVLLLDLGGHPALGGIWLPCPRTDFIQMGHGGLCGGQVRP